MPSGPASMEGRNHGFSVPELLLAGRMARALTMGLRRVPEDKWLWPDFDRAARAAVFDSHPEAIRELPGAEPSGSEVAKMIGVPGGLGEAARAAWEDLCILQRDDETAPYRLTAGALGFPTDWHLDDKLGLPLAAIHAPIHGYAEQLASGVDHFLNRLAAGVVFTRTNWFIVSTLDLRYLPVDEPADRFAHVTADNAGQTLIIRCERQTLRRLPRTGAILFTIGIAREPLAAIPPELVQLLSKTLDQMPQTERIRRHAPLYAEALDCYARNSRGSIGFSSAPA